MKKSLLLLLFISWAWGVRAQSAQIPQAPATVQSPNAASLGMYGEVPVSLYTGLPSIEVPLHTVQEGPITVPITLAYHASGFRPDMHPGWVGVGWNLSAGGAINRTVHDMPDENNGTNGGAGYLNGYYYNGGVLNGSGWSSPNTLQSIAKGSLDGGGDTEPDEFSFNFGGYSGKFYLNADGTWKVKCNKPITVTPTVPGMASSFQAAPFTYPQESSVNTYGAPQTFAGFTITTEDGTRYVFGGPPTTNSIEYQIGIFQEYKEAWVANSWYLTQILHPDGHQVTLNYERDAKDFIAQMYVSLQDIIDLRVVSPGGFNAGPNCLNKTVHAIADSYAGKLISPVYLASIQTSQSTVYFGRGPSTELAYRESIFSRQASAGRPVFPFLGQTTGSDYPACLSNLKWKQLNTIQVVSKLPVQPIKSFLFTYNDNPNLKERLTLLAVTEQGSDETTKKPAYRFAYNKYHLQLDYLAGKNDHWEFYNANARYPTINDYHYANLDRTTYYSERNPSPDSAVYLTGMLTRVVYPTGGVTDFLYEQHTYGKQLTEERALENASGNAGGVRIKKITSYSLNNPQQKLEKEYLYGTGYYPGATIPLPSSGILGGRARYMFDDYRAKPVDDPATYSKTIFSTQSVLPACSNSHGSHIGYSTVVEKRSDGSYTEYQYSNFDTGNGDDAPLAVLQAAIQNSRTLYSPYSSTDEERGKLLREAMFNKVGQRVKQRTIEYVAFNKALEYVPAMQALSSYLCPGSGVVITIEEGAAYKFYTYSYLPTKETETVYDANGYNGITTVKEFIYNSRRLVKTEIETDSKGVKLQTQYKYSFDFPYSGPQPSLPLTKGLVSMSGPKNMVGYPIQTLRLRNGMLTRATIALYSEFQSGQVLPSQVAEYTPSQPLDITQYKEAGFSDPANPQQFVMDPNLLPKLTFTGYDDKGNILGIAKEGNQLLSYQWGYSKTLPVAQATNAAPGEIFTDSFEEQLGGWDGLRYGGQSLSNPLRKAAHAGKLAGVLTSTTNSPQPHSFSKTTLNITPGAKKYVFSGWVYSEGPQAEIWLFQNRPQDVNSDGSISYYGPLSLPNWTSYINHLEVNEIGKWVYIEQEVAIQGDVTKLTLRLTNFARPGRGNPAGDVWFDDVRLYPADAQMTTYTHDPVIGVTSVSDANNKPAFYEYDKLNRLNIIRDQDGNIIKHYQYYYQK